MPRSAKSTSESNDLTLEYDLYSLPSAQHKAGLAGLLLLIESLRRRKISPLPTLVEFSGGTRVAIRITPESIKSLFDEYFAPVAVEIVQKDGKRKRKVFPRGEFLNALGIPAPWLALWRDVVANVVRAGAPAQFKPYRDRLDNPQKTSDWQKTWDELTADGLTTLSASDYLGAEAKHADAIPFRDRARYAFLLTFAPVVSLPYVSQSLKRVSKKGDAGAAYRFQRNAYVLVTPEVGRLDEFVAEFPDLLANLDAKTWGKDPYPAAARVSVPEEGGLEFLASYRITRERTLSFPIADSVASVQITHLKYGKGSPHVLHIGALPSDVRVLSEYSAIRTACWNLFYRELRVRNLLRGDAWYVGANALFAEYPAELFIQINGGTPAFASFGADVRRTFRGIQQDLQLVQGEELMTDEWADKRFASRVFWLMKQYVDRRMQEKRGMSWEDYKNKKGDLRRYREEREKVCLDAFLSLRGRDDSELVSYFTGTICSVPQQLNHDRYLMVCEQLLTDPAKVKTLAMLALSAHSYLWDGKKPDSSKAKGENR